MNTLEHYDIAVIGGGIAGLYCCLRAPPGKRTALCEATGRIGGKVETVYMEGFKAEYGSMRFDPDRQPVMGKLIRELQLQTEPFPAYNSPPAEKKQMMYGLRNDEKGLNALELFTLGIGRVLNKTESQLMSLSDDELKHLRRKGAYRNVPLWKLGTWNALTGVLSYSAVKYIIEDGSFFHSVHENPGAAGGLLLWVQMLQMSEHLKGIKGGVQLITDGILKKAKKRGVEVYTGRALRALSPLGKQVKLSFDAGEITADHVILALPSHPLKALKGIPENIRVLLDSVIEYPLLKCFFIVSNPWWEEDIPNAGVRDFPARELHYTRQGEKGMIMVYADRPSVNFWNPYVNVKRHEKAKIGGSRDLPEVFAGRMNIDPRTISSYGFRDWVKEPFGAGVHLWKPGVEPYKVMEKLQAFSLDDASPRNVHICGEAFSDFQGFMEGAVRSAEGVMSRVMG